MLANSSTWWLLSHRTSYGRLQTPQCMKSMMCFLPDDNVKDDPILVKNLRNWTATGIVVAVLRAIGKIITTIQANPLKTLGLEKFLSYIQIDWIDGTKAFSNNKEALSWGRHAGILSKHWKYFQYDRTAADIWGSGLIIFYYLFPRVECTVTNSPNKPTQTVQFKGRDITIF